MPTKTEPMAPTKVAVLGRNAILETTLAQETIAVPEWGGSVIVRCLTGAERDNFDQWKFRRAIAGEAGILQTSNARAKMATLCVVDENGEHLFTEADVDALGEKDGAVLDRIWQVAVRLSRIIASDADVEALIRSLKGPRSGSAGSA